MPFYFDFYFLKMKVFLIFLTMLAPFLLNGESNAAVTAKHAENLFNEKLYGDALPFYSQLFTFAIEPELKTQWGLRLAACHLEEGHAQTALDLLSSLDLPFYRNQALFLMSTACRQLGKSDQALKLLKQCSLPLSDDAKDLIAIEQGYHFIQLKDFENAKKILKGISKQTSNPIPYEFAQLQLAKISIMNHQFREAHQILSRCPSSFLSPSTIHMERTYLNGLTLLALKQESQAVLCFEELLPKALSSQDNWSMQIIQGLAMSYLRQALACEQSHIQQLKGLFSKTEDLLQKLLIRHPGESSYLLLSDFYLIKARCLSDAKAYDQAQELLDKGELFSSQEGKRQAFLKRASAAPSYEERSRLYEQLSLQVGESSDFHTNVLFLKGLNHFEEGLKCQNQKFHQNLQPLEKAVEAFHQALQHQKGDFAQTALTLKYLLIAYAHLSAKKPDGKALEILNQFLDTPALAAAFEYPEEISCLTAWAALRLRNPQSLQKAKVLLEHHLSKKEIPLFWQERCLKLKGMICLQQGEWQEVEQLYEKLLQNELYASSFGEAWFWRAYSADQLGQADLKKEYLEQAYTEDPQSPYAPIAYFHLYSYREYMQGNRKAIKHLQALPLLFPFHPLSMNASYLIGLYYKKDRLSEGGQLLRRKDWIAAIDAFQMVESTFETLFEKNLIPISNLSYFIQILTQAQLEKAQANLAIAQQSTAGKRQIYLKYAEEVFTRLIGDFTHPEALPCQALIQTSSPYPKIWAEAELQLAKVYEENKQWKEAEKILNASLEHYRQAQITQGCGLMHVWYAKGSLAQKNLQSELALECFLEAEKAVRDDKGLSPHEKLDLWIQQSLCYKSLNQPDQSMRLLSRVINEDAISPLRIKAMILRAEIYEFQGRPELAIKQLEAAARKGGEWSQQAKEKLEKVYGYEFSDTSALR